MTDLWLVPDAIFDGRDLRRRVALGVVGGVVTELQPQSALPADAPVRTIVGTLTPGFVDLQVNGGGGVLFNQNPTPDGIAAIIAAHRACGTVAVMPTVITDTPDVLARAALAAISARDMPGFAGLHIEGPHIATARRGTHQADFIRPMDDITLDLVKDLRRHDIPIMITLAPEVTTLAQIGALAATGAVVSLGHTDASAAQAQAAFDAGARAVTHLFNAMSPMQGRAPGMLGAAINSAAHLGFICDGVHVDDTMLALAIRARPRPDRMFLVSDAMPTVGGPDHFRLYGQDIRLQGGRLINAEGNLAGAHVTQAQGVARLIARVGIAPQDALRMAITIPANLIGADHLARMIGREISDIALLDAAYGLAAIGNHLA
ncbi:N-acetylglucosamine-6-phosphate deacetylase [Yoonia sp.]|uniref:N-acetylglucosamine-6-phosphate deacetylase n=1 Tax=Yoonia sp. TaxID=2212373 RepID=UPI0019E90B26|nr:amidohydrolase family protein [Yoonia sp.]MBE0412235.1 N-acetylglucosamine-6-phosphate deacetylase [Yoonia sp.]